MLRSLLAIFLSCTLFVSPLLAVENQFKTNNPDIYKFEFARSYISALSYFYVVDQRWSHNPPKKRYKDDLKMIRGSIEYLVQDNADLRISKGYILKYITSPNSLMRKVADMLVVACDKDIALNNEEKMLWQDWLKKKTSGHVASKEEKAFIQAQRNVELSRKESDKSVIKATILMTKTLLSQENPNDKGHLLAITQKQRYQLLDQLDTYGKQVLDWGLKPGQSTLNASIAVIREVLEDPVFVVHK
jgi:hypothetical protein